MKVMLYWHSSFPFFIIVNFISFHFLHLTGLGSWSSPCQNHCCYHSHGTSVVVKDCDWAGVFNICHCVLYGFPLFFLLHVFFSSSFLCILLFNIKLSFIRTFYLQHLTCASLPHQFFSDMAVHQTTCSYIHVHYVMSQILITLGPSRFTQTESEILTFSLSYANWRLQSSQCCCCHCVCPMWLPLGLCLLLVSD